MPNHKSCWKRIRQNETRHDINKRYNTFLRHTIKSFSQIDGAEAAREKFPGVVSVIDTARKKGILHRNKAARIKSRLSKKIV
jgi:small subunit ribosomal protein S20